MACVSSAQWLLTGAQDFEVNSLTAAAVIITVRPFSRAICWTAAAIGVTGRSMIASTPSSYQRRASAPAMSGLFWVSAVMISIGRPSTVAPKSCIAIVAAATEPAPPLSL